jgi:L-lactate permease
VFVFTPTEVDLPNQVGLAAWVLFDYPILWPLCAAVLVLPVFALAAKRKGAKILVALAGLSILILGTVTLFHKDLRDKDGLGSWALTILTAAGNGAAFGMFPIGWIVLAAIFLYTLTVETGHFEIVKHSVTSLSSDRRIQALLIAFSFGAFVEGAAGFGTPVAISAALLMGAGFKPLHAAGLALIANTAPVAYGALGTPILTLAKVTLPAGVAVEAWEMDISRMAGRQLPFFSLLIPAWLVGTMAGWRGLLGVWPALLVCGGSFALVQFLVANYVGPALVDVAGGLISLVSLALFLRVWQPAHPWQFPGEPSPPVQHSVPTYTRGQVINAWVPWLLLSAHHRWFPSLGPKRQSSSSTGCPPRARPFSWPRSLPPCGCASRRAGSSRFSPSLAIVCAGRSSPSLACWPWRM